MTNIETEMEINKNNDKTYFGLDNELKDDTEEIVGLDDFETEDETITINVVNGDRVTEYTVSRKWAITWFQLLRNALEDDDECKSITLREYPIGLNLIFEHFGKLDPITYSDGLFVSRPPHSPAQYPPEVVPIVSRRALIFSHNVSNPNKSHVMRGIVDFFDTISTPTNVVIDQIPEPENKLDDESKDELESKDETITKTDDGRYILKMYDVHSGLNEKQIALISHISTPYKYSFQDLNELMLAVNYLGNPWLIRYVGEVYACRVRRRSVVDLNKLM